MHIYSCNLINRGSIDELKLQKIVSIYSILDVY